MHKTLLILLALLLLPAISFAEPPFKLPSQGKLNKITGAIITTTQGKLFVKLFPQEAAWHVANFKYLSDRNYYDNKPFHIFKSGYLMQTGAANSDPASGPNYTLPPEFNRLKHQEGSLSMVRRPDYLDFKHTKNSHGSQFRIILSDSPHLDEQFTVFGKIVGGFDVLKRLRSNDYIQDLTVYVSQP